MSVKDLPLEIQGEIFTHARHDNSDEEAILLPVEVILSHVCSQWRNIAINLPILWTAFKFESHRRVLAPVDKLEEYLFRSKTQLIELYFDFFVSDFEEANKCFKLVEIAIPHACRWRRFTLFTDSLYAPIRVMDGFRRLNTPNLEYLAICPASNDLADIPDPDDIRPSVLTGGTPKLSVMRINSTTHFHSLPPLSNITTLTIQDSPEIVEYFYSVRTFRSILMAIPNLTNLSIESSYGVNPSSTFVSGLPRIVMPSLKVLRIAQDNCVLSILSLLDAPLLEMLLLHNLDLRLLTITPTIHKVTPFEHLDTLALLDCYNLRTGEVGIILYELACYATHIVISSSSDLSLISGNSKLLDSDKHQWPRLQCITFDLSTFDVLMTIFKMFERQPHFLTARVVEPLLERWREVQLESLMEVERICKLKSMKVGELMMDEYWPAPGGIFFREVGSLDHEKGFDWAEIIRARGPLEPSSDSELTNLLACWDSSDISSGSA